MLKLAPMSVTTRHSASAYPFQCQAGLPLVGPDHRPGGPRPGDVLLRPVLPLRDRDTAVPVHVGVGQQGLRQVRLREGLPPSPGLAGKWMAILDPKGEYLDLAERDRLSVLALRPGGPVRLNPLEAGPTRCRVPTTSAPRTSVVDGSRWWWPWPSRPPGV